MDKKIGPETCAVHGGEERPNPLRAITPPIARSTTFRFERMSDVIDLVEGRSAVDDYSRYANPTVRTAERKIAELEQAQDCVLVASGMAALTTTMFGLLSAGQHVIIASEFYRPSAQFLTHTLARFGITATAVRPGDLDAIREAFIPRTTRAILVESPSNPRQQVADIPALAELKRSLRGVKLIVDATLASPFNQTAIALGADVVIHSATKYLAGHNDLMAGAVCGKEGLMSMVRDARNQLGPVADPDAAYLLIRGIKTLPLRMRQHNASAQAIAEFLEAHPKVRAVYYAGLHSHPGAAIARRDMRGCGGVVSFEIDGDLDAAMRFCDATRVFQIGASLGGAESLLHPPAVFSYWDLTPDERAERGIAESLVRLAVGLESTDDLIADLRQALDAL